MLESKSGSWVYEDKKLSLPSEGRSDYREDFITDISMNTLVEHIFAQLKEYSFLPIIMLQSNDFLISVELT